MFLQKKKYTILSIKIEILVISILILSKKENMPSQVKYTIINKRCSSIHQSGSPITGRISENISRIEYKYNVRRYQKLEIKEKHVENFT